MDCRVGYGFSLIWEEEEGFRGEGNGQEKKPDLTRLLEELYGDGDFVGRSE